MTDQEQQQTNGGDLAGAFADQAASEECGNQEARLAVEQELQTTKARTSQASSNVAINPTTLSKIQNACSQIFTDIEALPGFGYPGRLIVFGDNAIPLFKAGFSHQVFVAASQVGQGRLIIMSSNKMGVGFVKRKGRDQMAILHENILRWVTRCETGQCEGFEIDQIETAKKWKDINPDKTVMFGKQFAKVLKRSEKVLEFLKRGGGVVLAASHIPWVKKEAAAVRVGHPFLMEAGIGVADDKVFLPQKRVKVTFDEGEYQSLARQHIGDWLKACCDGSIQQLTDQIKSFKKALTGLPPYILEAHRDKLTKIFNTCDQHMDGRFPLPRRPLGSRSKMAALEILSVLSNCGFGYTKVPNVKLFPGDVDPLPPLESVEVDIKTRGVSEFHPTGYYLPPGQELVVKVLNDRPLPGGWSVRVGAHSDTLYGKDSLRRWPDVVMKKSLTDKREVTVFSPYGGNIYIRCPDLEMTARLQLNNVIGAPYFDLDLPETVSNWESERRQAPGPWADMSGKHIRITLSSSSIREMVDPRVVMETWDRVMLCHLDLRGIDPSTYKKSWIVYDVQISAGGMHAGYPVMGHLGQTTNPNSADFVLNLDKLTTTGAWGPYHELGHNMQRSWWTWGGMREVTCNIFALHAVEVVSGIPVWEHDKINNRMNNFKKYLESGCSKEHRSLGMKLVFFAHLAHLFGWHTYKAVFAEYEQLSSKEQPRTDQAKIDQWLERFSRQAGVSIAPIMEFWAMKFSQEGLDQVKDLKPFLPDDKLTTLAEDRVKMLVGKYPGIIRSLPA